MKFSHVFHIRYGERTKLKLHEIITYEIFSTRNITKLHVSVYAGTCVYIYSMVQLCTRVITNTHTHTHTHTHMYICIHMCTRIHSPTGHPTPIFTLSRTDGRSIDMSRFIITFISFQLSIRISRPKVADEGTYRLEATNEKGDSDIEFMINIVGTFAQVCVCVRAAVRVYK